MSVSESSSRSLVGSSASNKERRIDQRTGDDHPALFAAGQGVRIGIGAARQTDAGKEIVRARVCALRIHGPAEQCRNSDVVHRAEVRQQARKLENEANVTAAEVRQFRLRKRPDIGAVEQTLPSVGLIERAEHRHQRRLAGAGSADDRYEFAAPQFEAGVPHGLVSWTAAVSLGQCLRLQRHVTGLPSG